MFVLDTNVVSELRKAESGRADPKVVAWASAQAAGALYISAITVLELELGVLMEEQSDPKQGSVLRSWLSGRVLPAFEGRVLAVDATVARCAAAMHVPNRRPQRDCLIAATGVVHGYTVVTRTEPDFAGTGAGVLNPWK